MKIAEFSVKNHQFTLVLFVMVIALGVSTLLNMPKSEDPELNAPSFFIVAVFPGASPEDTEELVVKPIEERFYELEDLKDVSSVIKTGVAVIQVDYIYENDPDEKYQEVVRELGALKDELPDNLASLEIRRVDPTNVKVLQTAFISESASYEQLRIQAEKLQDELEQITALKDVEIFGLPERLVRVDLNLEKLAQLGIPLNAVLGSIQSEMVNIPGGSVLAGKQSFNVKTTGNYTDLEEIRNTVVFSAQNRSTRLEEIADVYFGYETDEHLTRLNGYRCIFLTAAQKSGFNILQTQEKYLPVIDKFEESVPSQIAFIPHFNQAENVQKRLSGLGFDFALAIGLVLFTLLPLGYRASAVVMITIPLSLSIGLVLLNLMGYSLNQLSIVGLVVALGLLVDDSIVVVENIERWLRKGFSKKDAAIKATKQIGMAVLGFTATLIIAFMPLIFLPAGSGDFIRGLPLAVVLCVFASMIVSLTFTPFLSSILLKKHEEGYEGNIFLRLLEKVISGSYSRLLHAALRRPLLTLVISFAVVGGIMSLFGVVGFALFPSSEKPQFLVNIISPSQTNIYHTDSLTRKVEARIAQIPELEYFASNIGKGNPQIYYNVPQENARTDFGQLFIQLAPDTKADRKLEIINTLRKEFKDFVGAKVEVKNFEQGPPVLAPIEIRLKGDNLDTLRNLAARTERLLERVNGTIYIDNPVRRQKTDLKVKTDKAKARALGINLSDIDRNIRLGVSGLEMGKFSDTENEEYEILVGLPHEKEADLSVFEALFISTMRGSLVPLSQIASLTFEEAPQQILHYDKVRTASVSAFVDEGFLVGDVLNQTIAEMEKFDFPEGYGYEMGGEQESKEESFAGFGTIILVTVFLFIAVLILEFKTFKSTLIVLSVIPLGAVGAVLALWLTGNPLSFVAIIGLIALAGIEIKNSILLVDFTNQLREEGMGLDNAIEQAGEQRFLPIILTAMTAIGGLIPIAISTNPLISPLAIVIIGGLISSTLLSRVITPVVYKLLPPKVEEKNA